MSRFVWMRWMAVLLLLVVAGAGAPTEARADDERTWMELFPGVQYAFDAGQGKERIHLLSIDLCASGVSLRATAPGEGATTTSRFGERVGAQIAINGDFFRETLKPIGLAAGGGERWLGSFDGTFDGFVAFGPGAAAISLPRARIGTQAPGWMTEIVGGMPALVVDGEPIEEFPMPFCGVAHPRTAVGLSKDRRILYVAVVDGRAEDAGGMGCVRLARLMDGLGVDRALNLDGGGSSTLWVAGAGVINDPSDGEERTVGNHLAIFATGRGAAVSCPVPFLDGAVADVAAEENVLPLWSSYEDRSGYLCGAGDRVLAGWDLAAP